MKMRERKREGREEGTYSVVGEVVEVVCRGTGGGVGLFGNGSVGECLGLSTSGSTTSASFGISAPGCGGCGRGSVGKSGRARRGGRGGVEGDRTRPRTFGFVNCGGKAKGEK